MTFSSPLPIFAERESIEQVEEGNVLAPKFDDRGLLPVVTTDAKSGEVLMLGFMNSEALSKTIETGEAHYFSRTRKAVWHKGATSGLIQKVIELRIDDDQDAVWMRVEIGGPAEIAGASCHVGYRSCFYRAIPTGSLPNEPVKLDYREDKKIFDFKEVYGDAPNPTIL
jgi:phosphoribosyl-AMP cyclohydrolase